MPEEISLKNQNYQKKKKLNFSKLHYGFLFFLSLLLALYFSPVTKALNIGPSGNTLAEPIVYDSTNPQLKSLTVANFSKICDTDDINNIGNIYLALYTGFHSQTVTGRGEGRYWQYIVSTNSIDNNYNPSGATTVGFGEATGEQTNLNTSIFSNATLGCLHIGTGNNPNHFGPLQSEDGVVANLIYSGTIETTSGWIGTIVTPFIAVIAANWVPLFGLLATILAVSLIWRIIKRKTGA